MKDLVKKYIPVIVFALVIIILVDLVVILASERARRAINRLEEDIVVVEDTQVQILKTLTASPSATPTPTFKFRPLPVSVNAENK